MEKGTPQTFWLTTALLTLRKIPQAKKQTVSLNGSPATMRP
jgi:hypothetical protein